MIKLNFQERNGRPEPESEIELYSEITRIPFSITVRKYSIFPSTIYSRSMTNGDFVEFRFRESDKVLFETSLVNARTESVKTVPAINLRKVFDAKFYDCCIVPEESILDNQFETEILRTGDSICILFEKNESQFLDYYQVAQNLFIGADTNRRLQSVFLTGLSSKEIYEVFGF